MNETSAVDPDGLLHDAEPLLDSLKPDNWQAVFKGIDALVEQAKAAGKEGLAGVIAGYLEGVTMYGNMVMHMPKAVRPPSREGA